MDLSKVTMKEFLQELSKTWNIYSEDKSDDTNKPELILSKDETEKFLDYVKSQTIRQLVQTFPMNNLNYFIISESDNTTGKTQSKIFFENVALEERFSNLENKLIKIEQIIQSELKGFAIKLAKTQGKIYEVNSELIQMRLDQEKSKKEKIIADTTKGIR